MEQGPTPTMHRERVRLNFIAISQFRRRGGAPLRPGLPHPQPRKSTPAPLASLPCRPLQAKGMACVKNIAISKFHRRGEHCSPAKALCCRKAPRVEQSPTPTINRKRVRLNFIAISKFHRRGGAWLRPPLPPAGPCVSPNCLPINPVLRFLFGNVRSAIYCGVISPESKPK